ncbi:VOC family protein [Pseudobacillus wudalianchiensis]|uniref:Glyoxalase n=1 Tax=Pseudobacillus wudalianchiensis TaxID=1743143 RepID=A0A1B9AGA6_9BACI|nr:VOC family protein [Bacillus wudalianchiensis]OCA82867.1 glyoxalase [Bacillus wudalianchiensis]
MAGDKLIKRIEHVGIMVKNLEKSISFYTDIIGFQLLGRLDHPNGQIKIAFIGTEDKEGTQIELLEGYNDSLPVEGKVHHLALKVEGIESEITRLKEAGVRFIDKEITTLPNGSRYMFFEGPDGEWLELFETN